MIQPTHLNLDKVTDCLPDKDPELKLKIKRIPIRENEDKIIPVCEPCLIGNEKKYINDCIDSNWISSAGKYITLFEEKFANICNAKYAISCSNGTTALHLALIVFDIKEGDEVIIPTFTMIATANAVRYTGATPIFVDASITTWNIDVEKIEEKITSRTKAIIPVHTYGFPCDMDKIHKIAKKHNLLVIEDAAEAHGASYHGKMIGSISDATCFSFYANKIITTGEGGMITTNNKDFFEKAITIRDHAFSPDKHFWHQYLGYNFRMTNMQAAIGLAQIENFEELVNRRINNAKLYMEFLKGINDIIFPPQDSSLKNVFWMFSILVTESAKITRDNLRVILAENGIETRTFFIPIHLQPIYYNPNIKTNYKNAEYLCKYGLYLPSSGHLTKKEIKNICTIIY
ncbi:MAG: DegT/DnrJ/EryC1/StrS family aminotransferase [Chitinophagales bacterium]